MENKTKEWRRGTHQVLSAVKSEDFLKWLRLYCKNNNFSVKEFAKMCDMSDSTFCDYYVKKHPFLTEKTLNKIMKATGWNIHQISTGSFSAMPAIKEPAKPDHRKALEQTAVGKVVNETRQGYMESSAFNIPSNATDVSLTIKGGTYYVTYTVPMIRKQYVTKERFMELMKEV